MTKKELRKIYLAKRMALSDAQHEQLTHQICERLFESVDLENIKVIHTFLPIKKNKEVNTWLIIDRLMREYPNIRISVPRINNHTSELEHYYLEGPEQLELNTWSIPEPVRGVPTPTEKIDAVLVPLLAFDRQGHRLGYGRGFYDRFLSGCRPDCLKIGLSFFDMEEKINDISDKDISLNVIVTPESVHTVTYQHS
jgi:5-formyltetrahydrofolate cyclo-ligase